MATGKVLTALLVGAATGAAIGVLFAPDSGENTIKRIKDLSEDWMKRMKPNGIEKSSQQSSEGRQQDNRFSQTEEEQNATAHA